MSSYAENTGVYSSRKDNKSFAARWHAEKGNVTRPTPTVFREVVPRHMRK